MLFCIRILGKTQHYLKRWSVLAIASAWLCGQWAQVRQGGRAGLVRLLAWLSPVLLALVGQVLAGGTTVVNDAYSYIDEFNDNNGVDAVASSGYQNLGGLIEATAGTMTVQSPCFSLPQPAGGTFNKWLFMDVAVAQLANVSGNVLEVETCAGAPLLSRSNLAAGTTSIDLSALAPANTQLRLRWVANHTVSPALGGTPARLDFWKVHGDATGASTVAVTALTTTSGAGGQVAVRVNISSTGAITRNAVLRIPMSEINGLSATGAAVTPFAGTMTDAEKDYGNGAGMKVYRPVQLLGYSVGPDGAAATNALVGAGVAGELRYNLGTLPAGYSGSVNLNFVLQQGTVNGASFKVKAYLNHGATPANALPGLVTQMSPSALSATVTTAGASASWAANQWGPTNAVGPGQTNITTYFAPQLTTTYGVDAENVVMTIDFAAGSCTAIYNGYSMQGAIPANYPYRILQQPTVGAVADKTLILQFDRVAYDSFAGGANPWRITPNYSVPVSCANGSTLAVKATVVYGNPNRTATVTKSHPVQLNYCRTVDGQYALRTMNGSTPTYQAWPSWTEYYIQNGSMKAGDWIAWMLYGSDGGYATHTVTLDKSYILYNVPSWGTFHGLINPYWVSKVYKDSTGTAPLPTEPGFVATADPPHADWKAVSAASIGSAPFNASPNDNNPSAVVLPGTRLLMMKSNDHPTSVAPDYAGLQPFLMLRVADGSYGVAEVAEGTALAPASSGRTYTYETVSNAAGAAHDCGNFVNNTTMYKESAARPMVTEGHTVSVPAGQQVSEYVYPRNHKLASAAVKGKWVVNLFAARNQIDLASVAGSVGGGTVPPGGSIAGIGFAPPNPAACLAATSNNDPACMAVFTVPDNTQPAPAYGGLAAGSSDTDGLLSYPRFLVTFNILRNVPAGSTVSYTAEIRKTDLSALGGDNPTPTARHAANYYSATGSTTVLEAPSINGTLSAPANWPIGGSFSYQWNLTNAGNAPANGFYGS